MQPRTNAKTGWPYYLVAGVGAIVATLWLLTYLLPAGREMMLDMIFSFLLGLSVMGLLWWAARRDTSPHRFWGFLAAGWTVTLLGNVAWGLYEVLSGKKLPVLSWVDGLYLIRYALILVAYWRCLAVPTRRQRLSLLVILLAVAALALGVYLLLPPDSRRPAILLAGGIYPVLDAGLIYIALSAWLGRPVGQLRNALGLLALAMIAYGVANGLNFYGLMVSSASISGLASLFWPLSDICTGIGVLYLLWPAPLPAALGANPR